MKIGALAQQLGVSADAIRFWEREGLLPIPTRANNRYREYTAEDAERLRLLVGLRQLDLPLDEAAELAAQCAAGNCSKVSSHLRQVAAVKRLELRRRIDQLRYLDERLAQLESGLTVGEPPRLLIEGKGGLA